MNYREIPDETKTYVCPHVAEKHAGVCVISTEPDGAYVISCGCNPDYVEIAHYGHLRDKLTGLLDREVLKPGFHYWRAGEWMPWTEKMNEIFE